MSRKLITLLALVGVAISVAACYTVEGVGKDVKATGQTIEKAADKNKTY
jgi:predicted small secreted protein